MRRLLCSSQAARLFDGRLNILVSVSLLVTHMQSCSAQDTFADNVALPVMCR